MFDSTRFAMDYVGFRWPADRPSDLMADEPRIVSGRIYPNGKEFSKRFGNAMEMFAYFANINVEIYRIQRG